LTTRRNETAKIFECEWRECARGSENITQLKATNTGAFYPLCKSMQNNATVLPVQSDANVTCTHTRIGRNERRPGGQVKTHLSLHAQRRLFCVRCNTGEEKRPISSGINVVCTAITFSGRARGQYDFTWNANASLLRQRENVDFGRIICLLLYAAILTAATANRSSVRAVLRGFRMKAELMIERKIHPPSRNADCFYV